MSPKAAPPAWKAKKSDELSKLLSSEINSLHAACTTASQTMAEKAWDCGHKLLAAKETVGHGYWLEWVRKHLVFNERQARRYMQFAQEVPDKRSLKTVLKDGGLSGFLKSLADNVPISPEQAKEAEWASRRQTQQQKAVEQARNAGQPRVDVEVIRAEWRDQQREEATRISVASAIIESGFKAEAQKRHPDHGGTNEDMARLTSVRGRLMELLAYL